MKIFLVRIFGFVIGACVALVAEAALFFLVQGILGTRLTPHGLLWIGLPILIGISVSKVLPEMQFFSKFIHSSFRKRFWRSNPITRIIVVGPIFWICSVGAYVYTFEPYGYMSHRDYTHMFKIMLFPSVVLITAYFVYSRIVKTGKASIE